MKEQEAREVVAFVYGGFNREPSSAALLAWSDALLSLDADSAMRVARTMHRSLERIPTIAMFVTAVRAEANRARPSSPYAEPRCSLCRDEGWVVVYRRPVVASEFMRLRGITPPAAATIEELAPCPRCDAGRQRENAAFADGFWKGREWKVFDESRQEVELVT